MTSKKIAVFMVVLWVGVGLVSAQMGGGGGGGRPVRTPQGQPSLQAPMGGNGNGGQLALTPPVSGMQGGLPIDTSSIQATLQAIKMPTNMNTFDLQATITALPYTFSLDGMTLNAESSTVAYEAIVGFGSQYLGTIVAPIYAGEASTTTVSPASGQDISQITAQFPAEVQQILATAQSADGVPYWAIMTNGGAIVYADVSCTGANCTISTDSVEFAITNASLGAYLVYQTATVSDSTSALALIQAVYPTLANYQWTSVDVETGYGFSSATTNLQNGQLIAYYAGTVSVSGYTVVYATVGVGSGYAEIVVGR